MAKSKEEPTEKKPEKKGGKSGLIIGGVIGTVVGVALAALTIFMFFKPSAEHKPEKIVIPDSLEDGKPNYDMIKYDNITINPISASKRTPVFMISMSFKVKPLTAKEEFAKKDDAIKEIITSYLGSKKVEFYANPQFREVIKKELKTRVGKEVSESEIMQVYITYSLLSM